MKNKKNNMSLWALIGGVIGVIIGASGLISSFPGEPGATIYAGICGAAIGAWFKSSILK